MKKLVAIIMALSFLVGIMPASAATVGHENETYIENASMEAVVSELQTQFGKSNVYVENGIISVFVGKTESTQAVNASSSIYAPKGGSYTGFIPPLFYPTEGMRPYVINFLPHDETDALYIAMTHEDLLPFIVSLVGDTALEVIAKLVLVKFGISLTPVQISFLVLGTSLSIYNYVNKESLLKAMNQSSERKVRIEYCISGGWPVNLYYAWEGYYVNCSPWESFNPVFHPGEYR